MVTSYKYLDILWRKAIEKEIVEEIVEAKRNEREVKQNRKVVDAQTTIKRTIQRSNDKHARVEFTTASSTITMQKTKE